MVILFYNFTQYLLYLIGKNGKTKNIKVIINILYHFFKLLLIILIVCYKLKFIYFFNVLFYVGEERYARVGSEERIPAASAIAGIVPANHDLPYMTPPPQPNFSGDSHDSHSAF